MSHEYEKAEKRAIEVIENGDHDSLFVCASSQNGMDMDVEVVTGVDSDRISGSIGRVRLKQIGIHLAYLSKEANVEPSVIASRIVELMRHQDMGIEVFEE